MTMPSQRASEPCDASLSHTPSAGIGMPAGSDVSRQKSADSGRDREDSDKADEEIRFSRGKDLAGDAAVRACIAEERENARRAVVSRARPSAGWAPRVLGHGCQRADHEHADAQGDQRPHRAARLRRSAERRGDEGRPDPELQVHHQRRQHRQHRAALAGAWFRLFGGRSRLSRGSGPSGCCNWPSIAEVPEPSPIYTQGDQADFTPGGLTLPAGRYLISVIADGYKIDGAHFTVPLDPGLVTVELQPNPLPDSTLRGQVFSDTASTNGAQDPDEPGLAGFVGHIADTLGEVQTDVYGNPLCTKYQGENAVTHEIPFASSRRRHAAGADRRQRWQMRQRSRWARDNPPPGLQPLRLLGHAPGRADMDPDYDTRGQPRLRCLGHGRVDRVRHRVRASRRARPAADLRLRPAA